MAIDDFDSTLSEDTPVPTPTGSGRAWLVYVGCAENGFAGAGEIWPLDGLSTVRFGRGSGSSIEGRANDGVLHMSIPLGWVSHAHASLRVMASAAGLEFDLRDLGSRNGTHIERQPVPGIARLAPGQIFEVGRSFWMVRAVDAKSLPARQVRVLDPAGTSNPALCQVHYALAQLANSNIPILLLGETGTGKEVTARAIHEISGRTGPFVATNLAALSEERVDAILFGHDQPDSSEDQPGLLAQADGGTLFFDELGELSSKGQAKLHAALAEGRIMRSGDSKPAKVDVRVIASTMRDVATMVAAGTFRADLYSQLAGFEARLPPLRDRREDLGVLTRVMSQTRRGAHVRMATRAFRRILGHNWPFNLRELSQTLATAAVLAGTGGEITKQVLEEILERRGDMPQTPETVGELRAKLVTELTRSKGDMEQVARSLARQPQEIHRWIERFELEPEVFRDEN